MSEVGGPPAALDAPGVRAALDRYRRNALLILIGGAVLLIAFLVAVVRVERAAAELERTGYRVPGEVVDVDPGMRTPGSIDVSYAYRDVRRTVVIHLDSESPDYEVGDAVEVLIDRDDLDHVSVSGETNQSPWTVWPMIGALIGGLVAAIAGGRSLGRVVRQRRLLAAEPWWRTPARYCAVPRGRGAVRGVVLIEHEGLRRIFTVPDVTPSRLRRAALRDRHDIELVGDVGGWIVLRSPGNPVVLSASRPARKGSRRRWLRRAFPDLRR